MYTTSGACIIFQETVDYGSYLESHGCDFGLFTCCAGMNNTMLETFARDMCNTSDVCGYRRTTLYFWVVSIIAFGMSFLILCSYCFARAPVVYSETRRRSCTHYRYGAV